MKESTVETDENGVRLELTVVDTPGFGDVVDNTNWSVDSILCVCTCVF